MDARREIRGGCAAGYGRVVGVVVAGLAAGLLISACSSNPTKASLDAGQGEPKDADAGPDEPPPGSECSLVVLMLTPGSDPCLYASPRRPPVPSNVRVRIDGTNIAADAANGWHYGADTQSIVFTGDACDVVLKGAAAMTPPRTPLVSMVLGCGGPIP